MLQLYRYILYFILFHYSLLQDIEYNSLHPTVGPCCLSVLYIVVDMKAVFQNLRIEQFFFLKKYMCNHLQGNKVLK